MSGSSGTQIRAHVSAGIRQSQRVIYSQRAVLCGVEEMPQRSPGGFVIAESGRTGTPCLGPQVLLLIAKSFFDRAEWLQRCASV